MVRPHTMRATPLTAAQSEVLRFFQQHPHAIVCVQREKAYSVTSSDGGEKVFSPFSSVRPIRRLLALHLVQIDADKRVTLSEQGKNYAL